MKGLLALSSRMLTAIAIQALGLCNPPPRSAGLLLLAAIAAGCINWPMFRHDQAHSGVSQYNTAALRGVLKWKLAFPTGCTIVSSPVVDGNERVYVGAVCGTRPSQTGGFCAIDSNGKSAWCSVNLQGWPLYSSAAIGGAVYVGGFDSGTAGLVALNPGNGNVLWNFPAAVVFSPPTLAVTLSPITGSAESTIYAGSFDGELYAVRTNGTEKWHFDVGTTDLAAIVNTSPAVAPDGTVYAGYTSPALLGSVPQGGVVAVNPDGTLKWRYGPIGGVDSSPSVGGDGTIYFGSYDQFFYAVKPNGTTKWSLASAGVVVSSPGFAPGGGVIYFGSRNHRLYAIDPNALLKWIFTTGGNVDSSPAISNDGIVFAGSADHYLYAINPNGTLRWKFLTGGPIQSSPAIGLPGPTIYVGSGDGVLYAIQ
jgi:outer membrane protein assembly factor BamB